MIRKVGRALIVVCALFAAGCAEVPEEAITLSVMVGKDLEEVRRSHYELAVRYFAASKRDINRFIDDVYGPAFVRKALAEKTYEYEPGEPEQPFLSILKAEIARPDGDPLFYMDLFVAEAVSTIEATRLDMLKPVEQKEREVLRAINDAYAKLMNAHAVVTGHLASVRRVQQAQEELLEDVGLKDIREKFIENVAAFSDKVAGIVKKARKGEQTLDEIEEKIDEIKEIWAGEMK